MNCCTGFYIGLGAGLVAGVAAGVMMSSRKGSMKTPVGRSIQKLGLAVDQAVDNIISEMR
jgi:hypothetical protein